MSVKRFSTSGILGYSSKLSSGSSSIIQDSQWDVLTATPGATSVGLSWPTAAGSPVAYELSIGNTIINVGNVTSYTVANLGINQTNTFKVRPIYSNGSRGSWSYFKNSAALGYNNATGGTITTVSNYNGSGETWRIHTFSTSGTLSVSVGASSFRVLLVGGGHPGSGWGGGAGGVVDTTTSISSGNTTVTVGGQQGTTSISGGASLSAGGSTGGGSGSPQSIAGPAASGTHPVSGRNISGGGSGAGSAGLAFNYNYEPYAGRGGNPLTTTIRGLTEAVSSGGSGSGCSNPEDTATIAGSGGGGRAVQGGIAVIAYRIS